MKKSPKLVFNRQTITEALAKPEVSEGQISKPEDVLGIIRDIAMANEDDFDKVVKIQRIVRAYFNEVGYDTSE